MAVAIALVLGASACSLPGNVTGGVTLFAQFDDVGDMVTGHSVQIADVRIGSIVGIELTPAPDFTARVEMSVEDRVVDELDGPVMAVVRTTSLLGEKFIELRPSDDATCPTLADQAEFTGPCAIEAPELELVAETAVQVLNGAVNVDPTAIGQFLANDLATLSSQGAAAVRGRDVELRALIQNFSVIADTLADTAPALSGIVGDLDGALGTLAAGDRDLDALFVNLSETSRILADSSDRTLQAIQDLTALAKIQNEEVFIPFLDLVDLQISQLDIIVTEVVGAKAELDELLVALPIFAELVARGVEGDFALVYGLFSTELLIPGSGPAEAP